MIDHHTLQVERPDEVAEARRRSSDRKAAGEAGAIT